MTVQKERFFTLITASFAKISYSKVKLPEEKPTIGIILFKEENRTVIEFTLPERNEQIFAKEYQAVLPSKDALKKQLE